jgi:hypothetical protein
MKTRLYIILIIIGSFNSMFSQNIGINATGANPDISAMLDIVSSNKGVLVPRIALTGPTDATSIPNPATSLFVYNTSTLGGLRAGYHYNAGTAISPYWLPFSKTATFHSASTNTVTVITNGAVTLIPGTAITITVPPGLTADVDLFAVSGMAFSSGSISSDVALADLMVYKNGATFLGGGAWSRIRLANNTGGADMKTTSIMCRDVNLPSGTYTYDLRGNRFSGSWAITVGGNCASQVNCAQLKVVVNYK